MQRYILRSCIISQPERVRVKTESLHVSPTNNNRKFEPVLFDRFKFESIIIDSKMIDYKLSILIFNRLWLPSDHLPRSALSCIAKSLKLVSCWCLHQKLTISSFSLNVIASPYVVKHKPIFAHDWDYNTAVTDPIHCYSQCDSRDCSPVT